MHRTRHTILALLLAVTATAWISLPAVGQADDSSKERAQWEELQDRHTELSSRLQKLEDEHQKSVEAIEKLKQGLAEGEASRSDLEDQLRRNHRLVEQLEQLQGRLREVGERRAEVRTRILDDLDQRRRQLEEQLREAAADERDDIVSELNDVQRRRNRFDAPLPRADRRRIDEVLADARSVSDDHPRAMMAMADELEDTEQQLRSRLEAVETRIEQLRQARAIHRQSRQFGAYERFFDEEDRRRTIAEREQAVSSDEEFGDQRGDSSTTDHRDLPDSDLELADDLDIDDAPQPATDENDDEAAGPEQGGNSFEEQGDTRDDDDGFPAVDDSPEDFEPAGGEDETGDPFDDGRQTETILIESETDPDRGDDTPYFSDRALRHNIEQLREEREHLKEEAEKLRRKADQLRRNAEEPR